MTASTPPFSWLASFAPTPIPDDDLDDLATAWAAVRAATSESDEELLARIGERFHLEVLDGSGLSPSIAGVLDPSVAERLWAVPISASASRVKVATPTPGNPSLVPELEFLLGRSIDLVLVTPAHFTDLVRELVGVDVDLDSASWSSGDEDEQPRRGEFALGTGGGGEGRLLDRLVAEGVRLEASDVHLQATGGRALARFRVDGVLRLGPELSLSELSAVIGRAKAVGGMDPSVRLRPQDGRARVGIAGEEYDLRISTIPASRSESLVIRILAHGRRAGIEGSGLDDFALSRLKRGFLDETAGVFTVTGPTGSGKTTLLYALLGQLNTSDRHIHTVEDPIELFTPGLVQVQVNPKAGLDFASALRSILRQDPEVILVGETRDEETARMVTQAALTGHLVATTLHTIDTATTILRYQDLGIDVSELSEALNGVSAQRLVRALCPECREEVAVPETAEERWFVDVSDSMPAFRARGCGRCGHTGYRGRSPIVEVLLVDREMRAAIQNGAVLHEIRELATEGGMRSMGEVGVERVRDGVTDAAELRRVLGGDLLTSSPTRAPIVPASAAESRTIVNRAEPAPVIDHAPRVGDVGPATEAELALFIALSPEPEAVAAAMRDTGLLAYRADDVPHAAVWAEIHRPDLVVLDVSASGDETLASLAAARDALAHLDFAAIIVIPEDAPEVERVLLEHDFADFLAAPLSAEEFGFLCRRVLHRLHVRRAG